MVVDKVEAEAVNEVVDTTEVITIGVTMEETIRGGTMAAVTVIEDIAARTLKIFIGACSAINATDGII